MDFRYVLGLQEASVVAMDGGYARARAGQYLHCLPQLEAAGDYCQPVGAGDAAGRTISMGDASHGPEFPKPCVKENCEPAHITWPRTSPAVPPLSPSRLTIGTRWPRVAARQVRFAFAPDPLTLRKIASALNCSRRPAPVVEASVDRDGAWHKAVDLAGCTQAVVWVSPMSGRSSFPEDHSLFAGFLPPVRCPLAEKLTWFLYSARRSSPIMCRARDL